MKKFVEKIGFIFRSSWFNLGVGVFMCAAGTYYLFVNGWRLSGALDFVIGGVQFGFFLQRRLTDPILAAYKRLFERIEEEVMKETEHGYVSPYQLRR
jgi:hypothetical protein